MKFSYHLVSYVHQFRIILSQGFGEGSLDVFHGRVNEFDGSRLCQIMDRKRGVLSC